MASYLMGEAKAGSDDDALQDSPVDRRYTRHRSGTHGDGVPFNRNPRGAGPVPILETIPRFSENVVECPGFGRRAQEESYGLIDRDARLFRSGSRAHHVKRHRVGDKLAVFFPDLDRVIQTTGVVHGFGSTITTCHCTSCARHRWDLTYGQV